MACALKAELKCKDGKSVKFTVEMEKNLNSIMEAVKKINADISVVLTELVEEKGRAQEKEDEDEDEEEEDEDEEEEDEEEEEDDEEEEEEDEDASSETPAVKLKTEPPAKRLKSISSS